MPVATLIVIRPRVEVKAVKGNSLNANRNARELRTDFAIEAVPVHPEVGGRVAQPNKPGRNRSARRTPRFQDWRGFHRLEAHMRPRRKRRRQYGRRAESLPLPLSIAENE
jgi:hypothetical protein